MSDSNQYDGGNEQAAAIILENRQAYPPGLVQWALRWRASHPVTARTIDVAQNVPRLRLF